MKKTYFLVESIFILLVSAFIFDVSVLILDESVLILLESALIFVESADVVLPLPLQAANAPIANTTSNFFIVFKFCLLTNGFRLIPLFK
jgi:hypothetical protein